jgi:hypothetical protein
MEQSRSQRLEAFLLNHGLVFSLLLAGLCALTYFPAFNNGFISDDYIVFGRVDSMPGDWLILFSEPPECYRFTSYLVFGLVRFFFGYHAAAYYGFNLLLHCVNSILIWKLVSRQSGSAKTGMFAAVLFAAAQGHQEAIMWLAAMNETLALFFLLVCLLLWKTRLAWLAFLPFVAALFSLESSLILVGLLPWIKTESGFKIERRVAWGLMIACALAFAGLFNALLTTDSLVTSKAYSLSFRAIPVFLLSFHRLLFPWVYLAVVVLLIRKRLPQAAATALRGLGFSAVALLPFIFLTYQRHIPSRHEYLASAGIAWLLAMLIQGFDSRTWRNAFVLVFLAFNVGYIRLRKDAQFEERAAPTNRLAEVLREHAPQRLELTGFPGNTWIAKNTYRLVPGWTMDLIHVNESSGECPDCLAFRWEPVALRYVRITPRKSE